MRVLFITLLIMLFAVPAFSQPIVLSFDPPTTNADGSPLTDLAGYKLYVSDTSGSGYTEFCDVGQADITQLTCDITAPEGSKAFFVLRAYDSQGNLSVNSNEVSVNFPQVAPAPPHITGVAVQ